MDAKEKETEIRKHQKQVDGWTAILQAYPDVIDDRLNILVNRKAFRDAQKIGRYVYPDITGEDDPRLLDFQRKISPILDTVEKKETVVDAGIAKAKIVNGGDLSVRNVATSVMAEALKIPGLIADSRLVKIEVEGKREKGAVRCFR